MNHNHSISWNDSRPKLNMENGIKAVITVVLSVLCAMLAVGSMRLMGEEVFRWGYLSISQIMQMIFLSFGICFVMECSHFFKKKIGIGVRMGILLLGVVGLLWYQNDKENLEKIVNGTLAMAEDYVAFWNPYYSVSLQIPEGNANDIQFALQFWTMAVLIITSWNARMLRKNYYFLWMPGFTFALSLLVGLVPKENSAFLAVLALVLSKISSGVWEDFLAKSRRKPTWIRMLLSAAAAVFLVILVFVIGIFARETGKQTAQNLIQNPDEFVGFQKKLEEDITLLWENLSGGKDASTQRLDNRKPEFLNEPVLTLEMKDKGKTNVYLKGSYSNTYEDGVWYQDDKEYKNACKEAGVAEEEYSKRINGLLWQQLELELEEASLTYEKNLGSKAYFPYFSETASNKLQVKGDSRYTKKQSLDKVEFSMLSGEWYVMSKGGKSSPPLFQDMLSEINGDTLDDWYEAFVAENNTQVPEKISQNESFVALAGEIEESIWKSMAVSTDANVVDVHTVNGRRMALAYEVQKELSNYVYSLNLPELPENTDPVLYFLFDTQEGYCMHYASAATLLLRQLGVPARYVSGYVVFSSQFEEKEDSYEATILDSAAHAWVEIYLEGIGWIPVEVTSGYTTGEVSVPNQEPESQDSESQNTQENSQMNSKEETATEEEAKQETESQGQNLESEKEENTSSEAYEGDDFEKENPKDTTRTEHFGQIGKGFGIFIGILSILALGIWFIRKNIHEYKAKLIREIKQKRTRRAIRRMNRRIYGRLRLKGKFHTLHVTDGEFEKTLCKTYPEISEEDWKKYMDIVKAAAFSAEDFSIEEMEFCYKIYKKLIKNS